MRRWVIRLVLVLLLVVFVLPLLIPLPEVGADPRTLADADGQFVELSGLDIYYVERGPEDGQAVLLLHGLGGSTFSWRENMTALAEAGYRAVAYDRPPFGLSEKAESADFSAPAQAEIAAGLMDALNIETAVMVGHSAGGGVIAHFALQYPDRVDGLVFVAGAVGAGGAPPLVGSVIGFTPINRWVRIGARLLLTPAWYADTLTSAYGAGFDVTEAIKAGYARVLQARDWDVGFMGIMRNSAHSGFDAARLADLDMPALLIWGSDDTWVPLSAGERLAEGLPNDAPMIVYDDTGHMAMEERSAEFNADVIAWMTEHGF